MQKIGDIPNTRADSNGEFTDGNVAGGVPPTILPAAWFNTIQRELMSVLSAAEIDADSTQFNQVLLSIQKLIGEGIPDIKDASLTQKGIVQLSNATNSTSEVLAATPKAVRAVDIAALKIANNLSEIKDAGPAAVAQTLANLSLPELLDKKFDKTGGKIKSRGMAIEIEVAAADATYIQITDTLGNTLHQIGKRDASNSLSLSNVSEGGDLVINGDGVRFNGRKMGYLCEALNSGSGWWRDNDTGLLIQWGTTPAGSGTRQVNFPIPFKALPHAVVHFDGGWFDRGGATWGAVDKSVSGFTGKTSVAVEGGMFIAIGF